MNLNHILIQPNPNIPSFKYFHTNNNNKMARPSCSTSSPRLHVAVPIFYNFFFIYQLSPSTILPTAYILLYIHTHTHICILSLFFIFTPSSSPQIEKKKEKEEERYRFFFLKKRMKKRPCRNQEIWKFEAAMETMVAGNPDQREVILGLDGGTASTVCVCLPFQNSNGGSNGACDDGPLPEPPHLLARAVAGCSNHNSVGETAARDTLEQVMADAISKSGLTRSAVRAVCLAVAGVNHPSDQCRIINWLREIFPSHVRLFVQNDAVAALASGTMGKLHGCVLIAGTGTIAYGYTEDGREARASGAGPVLGDWGSGYGIVSQALTAVVRAYDGRGPDTTLSDRILRTLSLSSPDELIGWTYADPSWARIAALVPIVVSCAEAGDRIANQILLDAVQELACSVKAVVERLGLCGEDGMNPFPLVMVGGVLQPSRRWDIGKEVVNYVSKDFPGAHPVRPKVEPAVGAALLAWNFLIRQSQKDGHII